MQDILTKQMTEDRGPRRAGTSLRSAEGRRQMVQRYEGTKLQSYKVTTVKIAASFAKGELLAMTGG